jgi:hypothetical protein
VDIPAPQRQHWIIEPLLDAGLDIEQITALVFRLGFEAMVCDGSLDDLSRLVRNEPAAVQAAWHQTIDRLIAQTADATGSPDGPVPRPRRS